MRNKVWKDASEVLRRNPITGMAACCRSRREPAALGIGIRGLDVIVHYMYFFTNRAVDKKIRKNYMFLTTDCYKRSSVLYHYDYT
jgi:hypothetical protein